MEETTHLKLKKPGLNDYVIIEDLNQNSDAIDIAVQKNKDDLATHSADDGAHGIGNKAFLKTTDKSSIVAAVNEAFTSASNGKSAVGAAITGVDPKVTVPVNPTFAQLAVAIGQIKLGKKFASGTAASSAGTLSFRGGGSLRYLEITGLDFNPSTVIIIPSVGGTDDILTILSPTMFKSGLRSIAAMNFPPAGGSSTVNTIEFYTPVSTNRGFLLPIRGSGQCEWYAYE